jgi:hypothetical protein
LKRKTLIIDDELDLLMYLKTFCKDVIRDIINYYHAEERSGLCYGSLVELIVNAMANMKKPIIQFGEEPS